MTGATAADLLDEIPHSDAGFETTGPHESRKELADRLIRRLKVKDLNLSLIHISEPTRPY